MSTRLFILAICSAVGVTAVEPALAHVSEQGLVLLLPTKVYISAGISAVLLTVILLAVMPARVTHRFLAAFPVGRLPSLPRLHNLTSLLSLLILLFLLALGWFGARDPLKNPLPLYIWTFWWIGLVAVQGLIGNLWYWINPWSGLCQLLGIKEETTAGGRLHRWGIWPAVVLFLVFIMFALAYPAPDDPDRLAVVVFAYWSLTMLAMIIFGQQAWCRCGEFVTIVMNTYARMSPFRVIDCKVFIGVPGFRAYADSKSITTISMAVLVLVLLGCGSFDGLNETFWWLATIGVNPLEFPGRSAIIGRTVIGIILANALLVAAFFVCVWLGIRLATGSGPGQDPSVQPAVTASRAFAELSISMLPIAFAYHIAHYMITFLVNSQYLVAATSDPFSNGADILHLGRFYVTTGFLNTHHSVEILWLSQAGIVVLGHILSVIIAHGIAVRLFGSTRHAALSQVPLAIFMILYTFLGLWLLASPKGG